VEGAAVVVALALDEALRSRSRWLGAEVVGGAE